MRLKLRMALSHEEAMQEYRKTQEVAQARLDADAMQAWNDSRGETEAA
ncbi:MAG: hypothetical protein IPK42_11230 [Betaproteobacteria bacterium]|nr:hypothetical protein [Betaproteobacteria bacterium]